MMSKLQSSMNRFLGRGDSAVTVPPLDGALKPNQILEEAADGIFVEGIDNLIVVDGKPFASANKQLLSVGKTPDLILEFDQPITAMVANEKMIVVAEGRHINFIKSGELVDQVDLPNAIKAGSVTALCFNDKGHLFLSCGSDLYDVSEWQSDLMLRRKTGSIWHYGDNEFLKILDGLSYPAGLLWEDGKIIYTESGKYQLCEYDLKTNKKITLYNDFPGFPGRIIKDENDGYLLCIFAPRSQLIEFVMREPHYLKEMIKKVPRQLWIAPSYASGQSSSEPLQGGALKQMGILKPWAPTRSYGLLINLNEKFQPKASFHSRAGGKRHGITSAISIGNKTMMTSRGNDEIISLTHVRGI